MQTISNKYKVYPTPKPHGIVIFLHGAMEHCERYNEFYTFLTQNGYTVVSYNQPGHGKECAHHIEDFEELERNVLDLKKELERVFPNISHHLIGHSMGSLVARNTINNHECNFDKLVLIGTLNPSQLQINLGLNLINLIIKAQGKDKVNKFANYLTFGVFSTRMRLKYRSKNWINSDTKEFQKYLEDKRCCNPFTNNYIKALLLQTKKACNPQSIANVKAHEYLVLSGDQDPVSDFGKELSKFNIHNQILYKKMRHEILLEKQRVLVYNDILSFLEK